MEKYAITISRQFASMGRTIAQELSERLGIRFLDRDIVEETARRMNLTVPVISKEEESIESRFSYRMYPLGIGVPNVKDEIFQVQKNIIQDIAKKESCIIVGRCGSYCLKDHPRVLRVYVYASKEERIRNCVEKLNMKEKDAVRMLMEVDSSRENYHKMYIPGYKDAFLNSDLCINSGSYTIEEAAALIESAAIQKFGL